MVHSVRAKHDTAGGCDADVCAFATYESCMFYHFFCRAQATVRVTLVAAGRVSSTYWPQSSGTGGEPLNPIWTAPSPMRQFQRYDTSTAFCITVPVEIATIYNFFVNFFALFQSPHFYIPARLYQDAHIPALYQTCRILCENMQLGRHGRAGAWAFGRVFFRLLPRRFPAYF